MYYLIKWHRGTPTVPPVGAVNVPAENPKIQIIPIFEDFREHFHYKSYRIFIKICDSKKFNRFFFIENKKFFEKNHFLCFYHISSPISESFIAQLLLHRALNQKLYFWNTYWGNTWDFAYQLSENALEYNVNSEF